MRYKSFVMSFVVLFSSFSFSSENVFSFTDSEKTLIKNFSGCRSKNVNDLKCDTIQQVIDGNDEMAKALLPEIKSYILMSVGFVSLGIDDHCNKMTFTCIESFTTKNEKKAKRFREATGYGMINILPEKTKQRLLALDDYLGVTYYHEGINSSFNSSYKEYEDGMYRVGIDIPEGNYQLFATNYNGDIPIMGSYKLTKDTSGSREAYISSDHFKKNIFITIKNGQYLTINDAYAVEVK